MRFEIIILAVTGFAIANIYTDGKYMKLLLSWKKYYQMIGIGFAGLVICWLFRKNPEQAKNIILSSNEYMKYAPIDKNTTSFISPILDFTSKSQFRSEDESTQSRIFRPKPSNTTKRSVSETKKKFVAASQNWECGDCRKKLPAWFEVDHTIRLENGGSNNVDNLVALCRDCHGKKTAIENL